MKFLNNYNSIIKEFLRYCLVGGGAFLIDFSVLVFFTESFGINHKISAAVGFILGLIINYILSKIFVFKQKVNNEVNAFIIFALIGVIGLGLTELGLWLGSDILKISYIIVKIFTTGVVLLFNYIARKLIIFNNTKAGK